MPQERRYAKVALGLALAATVAGSGVAAPVAHTAARLLGSKDVKNGAVTSSKVRDGSLRRSDLAPGTLRPGATGQVGTAGPTGVGGATGTSGPAGRDGSPGDTGPAGGPGSNAGFEQFTDGSEGTP